MRRLVVLAAVLALALSLSVPAFAAESYVFEYWGLMPLIDFESYPDSPFYGASEALPDGLYDVTIFADDFFLSLGIIDVNFAPFTFFGSSGLGWEGTVVVHVPGAGDGELHLVVFRPALEDESLTFFSIDSPVDGVFLDVGGVVVFTPVSTQSASALEAVAALSGILGVVLHVILGNWFLSLLLCLSLVGIGVAVFRKLRRSR